MKELHKNAGILIVDDDEDDFIITSEYLRAVVGNSFQVDWAATFKTGLEHLAADRYDMYFVDYRLGAKSGVDFLKAARELACVAPIVLLTGKGNYAVDIEAMELGAVDYLVKSELNTEKMERCVRYALDRADTLKALRKSENKYRSIFEQSKDIIFVTDKQLRIKDINNAVNTMLGYTKESALGMNLLDFILKEEDKKHISDAVINSKVLNDHTLQILAKSGKKLPCTITLSPENNVSDDAYMQGIIHDITGLKKAEKTALQTEKLAATGRLVRTLAHEVRNPLNNISMSAEQLGNSDDDSEIYLDIIKRNSMRINNLIEELLRSSNPRDNTHKQCFMQRIIDDVIVETSDRLTLRKMQLQLNYPQQPVLVMADQENLKLALLNIVINAIEAMEEGKGKLSIDLQPETGYSKMTITDNGCGISEDNITRIFEPYFTRKKTGAGLGLAFTLNILRAHNAIIDVSSAIGSGTTFTITFPVADLARSINHLGS
jgi:PAS domain S-box-containing protein